MQEDIEKLQEQVTDPDQTDPDQDVMGPENFLKVTKNAGKHLRAADVDLKDRIAR